MKARKNVTALIAVFALGLTSGGQVAKLRVLHNFGSTMDGSVPSGPLILDSKGRLYGVTDGGPGQSGSGVAFALTPRNSGGWNETILHTFAETDGSPWGSLTFGHEGTIFGTTIGGPASKSEAYQLISGPTGWSFNVLYPDGAGPGLLLDGFGNLYGSIGFGDYFGAGAIGELSPGTGGWTYTQLYSFCPETGCPTGLNPPSPPIFDGKGNMWGTTTQGGLEQPSCQLLYGCGVIYEITPNGDGTWTYNVIHEFASSSSDGQWPYGGLVMDAAGDFYGSTWLGGAYNQGTIFKLSNVGGAWQETILYDFPSCATGCMVEGTLARDKAGNLYGTAAGGTGSCAGYTCGVVFKLAPQKGGAWKYSVLANFAPATGGFQPFYGVILDANGNLYGVTSGFGKYNLGTAFEVTP
jgi:uncharacterized repeat protein (TIGR03803 family)